MYYSRVLDSLQGFRLLQYLLVIGCLTPMHQSALPAVSCGTRVVQTILAKAAEGRIAARVRQIPPEDTVATETCQTMQSLYSNFMMLKH